MTGDYDPPGGEPWVVTVAEDDDGNLLVIAISENVDLDGVDALEHRFYPVECDEGRVGVYSGVTVHKCHSEDAHSEDSECPTYAPPALFEEPTDLDPVGTASVQDLPESIRERIGDPLGLDALRDPQEVEGASDEPLGPEAFGLKPDEPDDRGFY